MSLSKSLQLAEQLEIYNTVANTTELMLFLYVNLDVLIPCF